MKKIGKHKLYRGDCLKVMKSIPDKSVDMILCDLPYGTTACKWDTVIPFEPLWEHYRRIIKDRGAIVLFGSEPFSSCLRMSCLELYKYDMYWRKSRPAGYTNAKLKPLKDIETISVFSYGTTANGARANMHYYPQGLEVCKKHWHRPKNYLDGDRGVNTSRVNNKLYREITYASFPRQVIDYANPNRNNLHPTQKPVALLEYLIKTYTLEGETVLDNTMGSGSTIVACENTKRIGIGIEKDKDYFKVAVKRIRTAHLEHKQR